MRFEAIQIRGINKYNFIILTKGKPDSALRESIRSQLHKAMEALGREPDSYSVSILQNEEAEETREREYPELKISRNYLLFAMLRSSNSGESLSPRELEEQKEEIARGIFPPRRSRIALVLLYDSSLEVIVTQMPSNAKITYIENDNPWKRF